MLLHQLAGNYFAGYQAMEKTVKEGKVKSIGTSNFESEPFEKIFQNCEIKSLAKILLTETPFETLNLANCKIYPYSQNFSDDRFNEVIDKIKDSDIVIGSPMYWHSMYSAILNVFDQSYDYI